ncbi:MAG: diacylglycerol/lipid kinase family protein [Phycisphaerales bacterium JB063]
MTDSLPVLITANPFSGKGENRKRVAALSAALDARGIPCEAVWDLDERRATLAQPDIHERYRCLVSAGGDGSIAAAVNDLRAGLAHADDTTQLPIAMLPAGNENLFAQAFGHNRGTDALASAIARGRTQTLDAGDAGGRLFTLMASAGFDSEVVRRVDDWRVPAESGAPLKRVSRISYAPKIVGAVTAYRYPPVTLEADGQTATGAHAFVFNIGRYGMNLGLARGADPSDGLLDWVVFEKPGMVALAGYGLSVLRGKHLDRADVHHGRSTSIRLSAATPVPVQADGDPAGETTMAIKVLPGMLRVIDGNA